MSQADSRTVIDCSGAEKLLGEGDMIFISNNMPKPIRLQGPYITMEVVDAILDFLKKTNEAQFDDLFEDQIMNYAEGEDDSLDEASDEVDKYFMDAVRLAVEQGQISISMVQRRFAVGYSRAGKIIDEMEKQRLISPFEGKQAAHGADYQEEFERRFGKGGRRTFNVGVISLGCDKNRVNTEKMLYRVRMFGHNIVNDIKLVDVVIINTCAFCSPRGRKRWRPPSRLGGTAAKAHNNDGLPASEFYRRVFRHLHRSMRLSGDEATTTG